MWGFSALPWLLNGKKKKSAPAKCVSVSKWNTQVSTRAAAHWMHIKPKVNIHFFRLPQLLPWFSHQEADQGWHTQMRHTLSLILSCTHTHTQTTRPHKCRSLSIKTHRGPEGETDTSVRPRPKEDTRHDTWSKILRAAFVFITHASSYWFPLNPLPSCSTVFPFDAYLKRFLRFDGARCPFRSSFRSLAVQIWLVPVQCLQMSKTFGT